MSKLHSPCPEKHFDGNSFFFEKYISLTRKFALWAKKNRISAGRLKQSCQNIFFYVQENREEKRLCRERLYISSIFSAFDHKKMVAFALNCLHECRNWILSVRRKNLTKITIFWKKTKFLFINADLQIAVFGFWLSNFCRLVKSPNHVSVEIFFSDDAVFSKIHSHIQTICVLNEAIRSFQNYCGKFVKDSFYVSKWTIRGDFVILKHLLPFLNDFGTWQKKLRTLAILAEKIWAGSSKLFLASLEEDFEDNLFLLPFTVCFSVSKFEQVKLWNHQKFPKCR